MMKKIIALLITCFPALLKAQETKLPLNGNPVLKQYLLQHPELDEVVAKPTQVYSKSGGLFPLVDRFNYPGDSLKISNWKPSGVKKSNNTVVLNALNASEAVYGSGFGEADVLQSQPINLTVSNGLTYLQIIYSTGLTWTSGDSLVIEGLTPSGAYQNLWTSPNSTNSLTEIILPISSVFIANNFNVRFTAYTNRDVANTETFLLHEIALTDKWQLPAHQNFFEYDTSFFASKKQWTQATAKVYTGSQFNYYRGNVVVFDAFDEKNNVYAGSSGGCDTLTSNLIDVQQFDVTDSVYLRFFYRALTAKVNDVLHLEIKNNLGVWQPVWSVSGVGVNETDTFIQQINVGRFRHANMQFRLFNTGTHTTNDTTKFLATGFHVGKKIFLPFLDDFSSSEIYPNQKRFTSKHVYVNNHFSKNPPSRNVATFDGLDFRGNPYGVGRGYCDTLLSQPINLHGFKAKDSLYLSFFIEPQGYGELPNSEDSLVVSFRNSAANTFDFATVFNVSPVLLRKDSFVEVRLALIDSNYLHDDFQFMVKNIGSRTGNLNHWHVDYIRLDKGRGKNADFYQDVALTNVPSSMLKKYQSVPAKHFITNSGFYIDDIQKLGMRNNNNISYSVNFSREVFAPDFNRLDSFGNVNPNLPALTSSTVDINKLTPLPAQNYVGDSLVFIARYALSGSGSDNIFSNDTATAQTIFSNYFAYDDGSAEAGYAIKNTAGAVALGYDLSLQDTLYGISMFFNRGSSDVSGQNFNLMVWKAVNTNGNATGEIELKRVLFNGPTYTNKLNGFFYYKFDAPLVIPAGKFYIGWEQSQIFQLNVGIDENYAINDKPAANPDMWYKIDGLWDKTQLTGALMMRPLFGKWLEPPVGVSETKETLDKNLINMYPNPATDKLFINSVVNASLQVQILDITGKELLNKNIYSSETIDISAFSAGVYVVKFVNENNEMIGTKKLIIN